MKEIKIPKRHKTLKYQRKKKKRKEKKEGIFLI